MNHPCSAIVFDFDYTLADSSQGVVDCINYAMDHLGLPPVPAERACQTIGLSLTNTFLTLTEQKQADRAEEFVRRFIERSDQIMADATTLLEDTPRVIGQLAGQGLALGVVSTKFRYRIETVLARENLLASFQVIVGGEDVAEHKPDPRGLLWAIDRLSSTPETTIYVGDSVTDAETARRAGVPFVAVLSGTTPRESFEGYPTRGILEGVGGLPGLLAGGEETHP